MSVVYAKMMDIFLYAFLYAFNFYDYFCIQMAKVNEFYE